MAKKLLIGVDDNLDKRVRKFAKKNHMTVSAVVRMAINSLLNRMTTVGDLAEQGHFKNP